MPTIRALIRFTTHVSRESGSAVTGLWADEVVVGIGPAVAVELPELAHLRHLLEVEVTHDQLLLVGVADVTDELAARIGEVRLAVEVVLAERLDPNAIDGTHEVAVGDGVGDLLDAPRVLGQSARGGRWDEDHLGAVEAQGPRALRE